MKNGESEKNNQLNCTRLNRGKLERDVSGEPNATVKKIRSAKEGPGTSKKAETVREKEDVRGD